MWREKFAERVAAFLSRPQTRRQKHLGAFERLEEGAVSTGVLSQWDGRSALYLCEDCNTLNQTGYLLCRRCAGLLRRHPRLQPSQIDTHLDAAEAVPDQGRSDSD
ncbi:hypothetical protein [Halovenus sp. HT40]|uniref:hypothetical protein n=1 Tax=Halovenus sp. HT40 TaxID=3126691 RepID=UPI00300F3E7A